MFAKANHASNCGQTYVAKAENISDDAGEAAWQKDVFTRFAVGQGYAGAGAYAVAQLPK